MMRYARAAIGLMAAIFVAAFVHSLLAPRLAEGAYGAAGESGWLTFIVDLLAFGGTWVTVAGLLANRAIGRVLESLLAGTAHATPQPVGALPAAAATANPAPASSNPKRQSVDGWTTAETLAGRSALKALKGGDAGAYLRAFRLLHPESDAALTEAMPAVPTPAPAEPPKPKARSTRGSK